METKLMNAIVADAIDKVTEMLEERAGEINEAYEEALSAFNANDEDGKKKFGFPVGISLRLMGSSPKTADVVVALTYSVKHREERTGSVTVDGGFKDAGDPAADMADQAHAAAGEGSISKWGADIEAGNQKAPKKAAGKKAGGRKKAGGAKKAGASAAK